MNKHTERDPKVLCDNDKCAEVRGINGVVRQSIKKSVIARAPKGQTSFTCYDCQMYGKTNMTRSERKTSERKRRADREEERLQEMTAETT